MPRQSLIVEYKNGQPIELIDLATSLSAIGNEFKRFANIESELPSETKLYVHEIRPGSTIAELVALAQDALDIYESLDSFGGFTPYLVEQIQNILHLRPASKEIEKQSIRNITQIVRPTSIDNSGSMNLIDNRHGGVVNVFNIPPRDAAAIVHNGNHLLNSDLPGRDRFSNEPMILYQLRDAPPGKTGDFGIIDSFSKRPHKLFFASEGLKDLILHDGPFESIFWVDGTVKTAGGSVVAYVIESLREVTPRDL